MENKKINYGEMTDIQIKKEEIVLTQEWDKVFPKNENVNHEKVAFVNHFGITLQQINIHLKIMKENLQLLQFVDLIVL